MSDGSSSEEEVEAAAPHEMCAQIEPRISS